MEVTHVFAALIMAVLPALLVPHVHAGEQLRYRTADGRPDSLTTYTIASVSPGSLSWTVSTDDPASKEPSIQYTQNSDGVVVNNRSGLSSGAAGFVYNAALFGAPPQLLEIGTHWSNTLYDADRIDFWSLKVADIQPKLGLVRLHLELVRRLPSTDASYYEAQTGEVTFVNGIMTNLTLDGYLTTTFDRVAPYHHQDISYSPDTRTGSFRISRRTTLVSTVP